MTPFRILCLDGGGIRGIFTAVLLNRLQTECPTRIDSLDMVAGTSTGGIIALGLAAGLQPIDGVRLYRSFGPAAFRQSFWRRISNPFGLFRAKYDNLDLKEQLENVFSNRRLRDLEKRVLITSFDLDATKNGRRAWKAKFFHNFPNEDSDGHELIVDVAMRTSAAPTFFPTYQGFVDGGVVANNPSLAALAQARDVQAGNMPLENIRLFSLNTGELLRFVEGERKDWGVLPWAPSLVRIITEGVSGVTDFQCRQLLGDAQYHRLQPVLRENIRLDDVSQIDRLVALAERVDLTETAVWLKAHFLG